MTAPSIKKEKHYHINTKTVSIETNYNNIKLYNNNNNMMKIISSHFFAVAVVAALSFNLYHPFTEGRELTTYSVLELRLTTN